MYEFMNPARSSFPRPSILELDTRIFVHSYVLALNADNADRAFDEPPNQIGKRQRSGSLLDMRLKMYERRRTPVDLRYCHPNCEFRILVRSYAKIDGADRTIQFSLAHSLRLTIPYV